MMVYDDNCRLSQHVQFDPTWPVDVRLPVDVFHFKSKHKLTDTWCQTHCNPIAFPELQIMDEKTGQMRWFFNTSVAEQTNVWFGGYHAICREMRAVKYDFILDQVILMRNEATLERLEKDGMEPKYWSEVLKNQG
jgi:hypothetical protein